MSRGRAWCFTINNYEDADIEAVRALSREAKYMVVGREVGDSGTPHLQGYVYFSNARGLGGVKKGLPRAHLEIAKGDAASNRKYCTKDDDILLEEGDMPMSQDSKGEAMKEKWRFIINAAKEGRLSDIEDEEPGLFLLHYSKIKQIQKDHMKCPADLGGVCGVWLYGDANAGKSWMARDDYPNAYMKRINKWWDGYQNHDNVIIDDIDKGHAFIGHDLKIWADRYAYLAEVKGGGVAIRPKAIVVTSQYKIEDIWEDEETRAALKRRFKVIHVALYRGKV